MVWWLVLPQFQLHQPLTSCIGQLGCFLGGFFGQDIPNRPWEAHSHKLIQEAFGGHLGDLKIEQSRFISFQIIWYCFKYNHFIQSISKYSMLDWLVPSEVWAKSLRKSFVAFLFAIWNHLDRLRSFQLDRLHRSFQFRLFQDRVGRNKIKFHKAESMWLDNYLIYKNTNPFNIENTESSTKKSKS